MSISSPNHRTPTNATSSQWLKKCTIVMGSVYCLIITFKNGSIACRTADSSIIAHGTDRLDGVDFSYPKDSNENYNLANIESNGFFTDISNDGWERAKRIANDMQPNYKGSPYSNEPAANWFQKHYEPEFSCPFEVRIGVKGDGGKWVCDPHRIAPKGKDCLVYSVGSYGDAAFEKDVLKQISPDCQIHVFDFGDYEQKVKQQTKNSPNVHYHRWGISDKTTTDGQYKTLLETVELLGHVDRTIDIFKIDCEGCELDTYQQWLDAPVTLQQILVEVHGIFEKMDEPGSMKIPQTPRMFESLHDFGYAITHKEPNIQSGGGKCVEYAFLLLSPEFWADSERLVSKVKHYVGWS